MANTYQCPKLTVDKTFNTNNADSGCGCAKILDGGFKLNSSSCKVLNGYKIKICGYPTSIFVITLKNGTVKTIETKKDDLVDYKFDDINEDDIQKIVFKQLKTGITDISKLFNNCKNMTDFVCNADLSHVNKMTNLFGCCKSLTTFPTLYTNTTANPYANYDVCPDITIFVITLKNGTVKTIETKKDFGEDPIRYDYENIISRYDVIKIELKQLNSKVSDISSLFNGFGNMTDFVCNADLSQVTKMNGTWAACKSLTSFPKIDTSNVTSLYETWIECDSLTSFPKIDTSNVTSLNGVWNYCDSLTSFPKIDTSNVTNMNKAWSMCSSLASFPKIDTSNVTNLHEAWEYCQALTSFPQIDTSKVTNMNGTWSSCSSLTSFPQINTSKVTNMRYAWNYCGALTSFPSINTDNVTNMRYTWHYCGGLTSFDDVSDCSASDNTTWYGCDNLDPLPCGQ